MIENEIAFFDILNGCIVVNEGEGDIFAWSWNDVVCQSSEADSC